MTENPEVNDRSVFSLEISHRINQNSPSLRGQQEVSRRSFVREASCAMSKSADRMIVVVALCLAPCAVAAQELSQTPRITNAPPKASGTTPRTVNGHPDLTGVWNGLGDNLLGVPNQMANDGISVDSEHSSHDIATGIKIATFPRTAMNTWDASAEGGQEGERAASLLRRVGSNRPVYKPQYWQTVKEFDQNANEEDPSNNCMPAGIPRGAIPSYIGQMPNYFVFIYPGQGGLIATQTMYRMVPMDGRKHTPLEDLDGTYTGEAIGHWEGDTLVVDTWGFNSSSWFDQTEVLPQRKHARDRTLPPRRKHADVDGDGGRSRRAAGALDHHAAGSAAESQAQCHAAGIAALQRKRFVAYRYQGTSLNRSDGVALFQRSEKTVAGARAQRGRADAPSLSTFCRENPGGRLFLTKKSHNVYTHLRHLPLRLQKTAPGPGVCRRFQPPKRRAWAK